MGRGRRKRPKYLAGKLRQIRLNLGWTQQQLADRMDLDSGTISRFENNQREPDLTELLQYARLGRTTMEVLADDKLKLPR
jgi:transcriptional regulator with XRE-family HTH domain